METMRISEVARRSGVPATTLRYYEDRGLLAPRRAANGYRVFDEEVLDRLRFIAAARHLDLPLDRVADLVQVWQTDPCASVKARLRPLLADQLDLVDTGLADLQLARRELASALRHLSELPDGTRRCDPGCAFLAPRPAPPPVACSLGPAQDERVSQWHEALRGAPRRVTAGGVRLELPAAAVGSVAELAAAEQECCPFLSFDLSLRGATFTLTITTPRDGAPVLARLLPDDPSGVEAGAADES